MGMKVCKTIVSSFISLSISPMCGEGMCLPLYRHRELATSMERIKIENMDSQSLPIVFIYISYYVLPTIHFPKFSATS